MIKHFSETARIAKIEAGIARLKKEIDELRQRYEKEAQTYFERGMHELVRASKEYARQCISWREDYIRRLEMEKPLHSVVHPGDSIYERKRDSSGSEETRAERPS
jgi:N-methylhydantoinase B/oxoprolinase/acetone carboxylase alpha subunit